MRVSSKRPQVKSSTSAASQPPTSGDPTTKEYVDLAATVDPSSTSSSSDASLRSMLEIVMTIETAQGQILVDVLTELQALNDDLASSRRSPPPPFDDES